MTLPRITQPLIPPQDGRCGAELDPGIGVFLYACVLPFGHEGHHRTEDGAMWGVKITQ